MALKPIVNDLVEVPGPLRDHYAKGADGKFYLTLDGEHPKVAEFRNTNVELLKERDALKAKLEKPDVSQRVTELERALAAAQTKADRALVRDTIRPKAIAAGALPAALPILLDKADAAFTVEGEVVKGKTFSIARPGEPLSIDEWLVGTQKEFSFLFAVSSGGGADPKRGGGTSSQRELRNPTPQQLGEHSKAIAEGKMKVIYD